MKSELVQKLLEAIGQKILEDEDRKWRRQEALRFYQRPASVRARFCCRQFGESRPPVLLQGRLGDLLVEVWHLARNSHGCETLRVDAAGGFRASYEAISGRRLFGKDMSIPEIEKLLSDNPAPK